jgi:hypothetical protein
MIHSESTTTLGNLFPELQDIRTGLAASNTKKSGMYGRGTARKLKVLYPEMASWSASLLKKAWHQWQQENGLPQAEPTARDERFPEYLVSLIKQYMQEHQGWR